MTERGQRSRLERDLPPGERAGMVLLFECQIPIRWGDMDSSGHVNNVIYFRYMEQIRVDWLASLGLTTSREHNAGHIPVMANQHANYRRELHFPGTLACRMFGGPPGRTSFETGYELRRTDEPARLYADGGGWLVWFDTVSRKPAPLPEIVRGALAASSGAP